MTTHNKHTTAPKPKYHDRITPEGHADEMPKDAFQQGQADRIAGKPCQSANGEYLDGWYSATASAEPESAQEPPTRQFLLNNFNRLVKRTPSSQQFQFERIVRSWMACGYPLAELPVLLTVTMEQVVDAARKIEEPAPTKGKSRVKADAHAVPAHTPGHLVAFVMQEIEDYGYDLSDLGGKTCDEITEKLVAKFPTFAAAPETAAERDRLREELAQLRERHSFKRSEVLSKGASHDLCSICGLSEIAEPHRESNIVNDTMDIVSENRQLYATNEALREQVKALLALLNRSTAHIRLNLGQQLYPQFIESNALEIAELNEAAIKDVEAQQ